MDEKRIIEVNGVKLEIDLRTAKRVDHFRVGDAVKVLIKEYTNSFKSHFGMIVGFDEFKNLPTIIVAYIDPDRWAEGPLKMVYINEKTEGTEICAHDANDIGISRADIEEQFNRQIEKKKEEIKDLQRKQSYFHEMFGRYFVKEEGAQVS